MNSRRWILISTTAAVLCGAYALVGPASAEPAPEDKPAADATKVDDITAESPEALLKLIKDAEREIKVVLREAHTAGGLDKLDADRRKQLGEEVLKVAKAADLLAADKQAAAEQVSEARKKKITSLALGAQIDPDKFAKLHEAALEELIEKSPDDPAVAQAVAQRFAVKHLGGDKPTKEALEKLVEFAKTYPENPHGLLLFKKVADDLVSAGKKDDAESVFKQGIELYSKSPYVSFLEDGLKQLAIIGKPMEVKGPTPDGAEVDLASLKGKVVLVDFWATWCGPCVAELPNVKEVYKKYHDKGFEIIGVSLDGEKDALTDFVKENDMPWPQILFTSAEGKVEQNKVATQHNINAIPSMFLIGRDGNVAAAGLRGEELGKAVAREIEKAAVVKK